MRLPAWLAKLLARIFPRIEYDAILQCERCGREIAVSSEMSEAEMHESVAAHERFFHS